MPAPAPTAPGLGQLIRERRIELGYSADQLGNMVGVHQTTISNWERGQSLGRFPRSTTSIAAALDVDPDVLRRLWWDVMGGYLKNLAQAV